MDRATLMLLGASIIPGFALTNAGPGGLPGTAAAVDGASEERVAVTVTAEDTPYGCKINVRATNNGSRRTAISRDSQVRSFSGLIAGPWKKLGKSVWISPGKTAQWYYDLTFSCNADRGYRFLVKKFDSSNRLLGEHWYSYPTNAQRTRATTLNIGDLDRFF